MDINVHTGVPTDDVNFIDLFSGLINNELNI